MATILIKPVFDNREFKEGAEEIKSTFSDLDRLNNSTLNTSNRQINNIQSQINDLFNRADELERSIKERQNNLNQDFNNLKLEKSTLDELSKQFQDLAAKVGINILEDAKDAFLTSRTGRISSNQVQDVLRATNPQNTINEIKAIEASVKLLLARAEKQNIEQALERNAIRRPRGPASNTERLTAEKRAELLNRLAVLESEINELLGTIDQNISERIQRQFPDFFAALEKLQEIRQKQQEIANLETNITGNEAAIAQEKADVEALLQSVSDLLEQRDALGDTFFPELDLGIDEDTFNLDNLTIPGLKFEIQGVEGVKETLQDITDPLEDIDKTAIASAMSFDTMSDASVGLIGNVIKLKDDGFQPLNTDLDETKDIFEQAEATVGNLNPSLQSLATVNQNVAQSQDQVNGAVGDAGDAFENGAEGAMQFAEETANASQTLDSLGVFAADIAANINDAFSDLLFNALKGNIDSFGDLWEDTLDTMLQTFSQFASTIISNPIRIILEGALSGNFGGGGGGGGGGGLNIGGLFGGLGNSFSALGGLFGGGGLTETVLQPLGNGLGFLPVEQSIGFIGNLTSAIPAIGAIAAAVTTAVSIILPFLKKTPRLDLDFDKLRDDAGKSLGVAAEVFQFLDEDIFNNEIFNRSVSRQAGLGLGSELPNVIREAIEGQIRSIQDIINRLPSDLASSLNDALLNTAVDIESEVKGDRLLEFDETKDIQEKFEQFINGDLQARFVFAIREFFTGAFEALGALPDAARAFVEGEFETFQGLNREQRAEFGANFVEEFGAVVDEHVNDVRFAVSKVKEKVDDLHDWHNKTDEDGVFNWYVKRSLEDVIKDLGSKIELQIGVQTKILQHMQKMEELHRKKLDKGE